MHDANLIANRMLDLAAENGDTLTPMQLLKLVYIAHGWMQGLYGVPLIRDRIEAWKYGPVIPRVYASVRQFRSNPVTCRLTVSDDEQHLLPIEDDLVVQVYRGYGKLSGIRLSALTHQPGTPWALTYKDGAHGVEISNDLIEEHYARLARERNAA